MVKMLMFPAKQVYEDCFLERGFLYLPGKSGQLLCTNEVKRILQRKRGLGNCFNGYSFNLGTWKCSGDGQWWWVHNNVNVLIAIELIHLKIVQMALAGVAQWIECQSGNRRVAGLIPSQGTCLGCGPGPQLGACKKQLISLTSMFLSLSLLSPLSKNK